MQEFIVGRDSTRVTIKIPDNQSTVSRVHAKLVPQGAGKYVLQDLGSSSGTFVQRANGWERVQQAYVTSNETIRLGDYVANVGQLVGQPGDQTVIGGLAPIAPYPAAGYPPQPYGAPMQPMYAAPAMAGTSPKSKVAAGLLAIFLGALGIHKFYLGFTTPGIIMLLCGTLGWLLIIPAVVNSIIALIEGIIYLTTDDAAFHQKYVVEKKQWF